MPTPCAMRRWRATGCDVTGPGGTMTTDPGRLVEDYLIRCEARDLTAAARLLAPGAVIVFPGDRRYHGLAEMFADAATRYRRLRKRRQPPTVAATPDGATLVVSRGTLEGAALDGTPFSNVRYLDLFVVRDGLIEQQHVFNDLAEVGIVQASAAAGAATLDTHDRDGTIHVVPTSETLYRPTNRTMPPGGGA